MSEEQKVTLEECQAALAALETQEVEGDTRFAFGNRQPPAGYVTLRDAYRVSDSHPSWLRTMVSQGKLDKYDEEGAPAVIKNIRGVWALRISALNAYDQVKRTPGESTGEGAGYRYEPQVLKAVKRAATAIKEYADVLDNAEGTEADVLKLADHLKSLWDEGKIGKAASGDEDESESESEATKAEPGAADDDADIEFDFDEID